jgi:hypothetical protein
MGMIKKLRAAPAAIRRRRISRRAVAASVTLAGGGLAACGTALIFLPAGVILGGLGLVAYGLLAIDIDGRRPR